MMQAGGFLQVLVSLALVLGLMAAAAWVLRRLGGTRLAGGGVAKVVGGVSVGSRERVLVVEVGEQWIVIGVAPGRVSALSTLPRQDGVPAAPAPAPASFPAWLRQNMDQRNVR